jgi:hypothetical protein
VANRLAIDQGEHRPGAGIGEHFAGLIAVGLGRPPVLGRKLPVRLEPGREYGDHRVGVVGGRKPGADLVHVPILTRRGVRAAS